jgi:adenylate cyclase class 2
MESLEIEVKYCLTDISLVRNRIFELGAEHKGKVFETNLRFEDAKKCFLKKRSLLRLRQDNKTTLTFKSPPPGKPETQGSEPDSHFKIHNELEVEISDFDTMKFILESIGFHTEQTYEKWRETFVMEGTYLCLDTMPFGNFLEIEGEKEDIKRLSGKLDLNWDKRICINYLKLFEIIKNESALSFSNVTFKNFENIKIDLEKLSHLFEAGKGLSM